MEPLEPSYDSIVYLALRELAQANTTAALQAVQQGRNLQILSLANTSLEAATTIYIPLARLQALQVITDTVFVHKSINLLGNSSIWNFSTTLYT